MAKNSSFGLVGLVAAIACASSADDGEDEDTNAGGGTKNASSSSSVISNDPNIPNPQNDTNTSNPTANGGSSSTTTNPFDNSFGSTATPRTAGGGTVSSSSGGSSTIFQVNPNRQISDAEAQAIRDSACNAWAFEPEIYPTKLELVIDVSSSMNSRAPGTNRSKWEVTRDALIEAVPGLETGGGLPGNTAVGLMFYPNMVNEEISSTATDTSVCLNTSGETPMAVLGGNEAGTHRTLLRQRLSEVVLGRGTPTADAYLHVLENTVLTPAQLAFEGDAYMLLITDGMPTLYRHCYNPAGRLTNLPGDEVVAAVDYAFNQGVKTFIVGSPGSEEMRPWLSRAAFLGATAAGNCNPDSEAGPFCHLDMTQAPDFSVALRNGLNAVMSQISGCKFEIPPTSADGLTPTDPSKVNPVIRFSDGRQVLVGRATPDSASCLDGFRLINNGAMMELCKNTCNELMADVLANVQFIFGCTADELGGDLNI